MLFGLGCLLWRVVLALLLAFLLDLRGKFSFVLLIIFLVRLVALGVDRLVVGLLFVFVLFQRQLQAIHFLHLDLLLLWLTLLRNYGGFLIGLVLILLLGRSLLIGQGLFLVI